MPSGRAGSAWSASTRPAAGTEIVALEALDRLARVRAVTDDRARRPAAVTARRVLRAVPGPLRRGGSGRAAPDVGPAALRAGPRLATTRPRWASTAPWYRERGLTWLVRAAEVAVLGDVRVGDELTGTTQVVGCRRVWARRRTEFLDAAGDLVALDHTSTGSCSTRAAPRRASRRSSRPLRGADADVPAGSGRRSASRPSRDVTARLHRPAAGARSDGPCQQRGLCRLARRAGHRAPAASRPSGPSPASSRLEYARAAEAGARRSPRSPGATRTAWSCRIADAAGTDLLRARLERISPPGTNDEGRARHEPRPSDESPGGSPAGTSYRATRMVLIRICLARACRSGTPGRTRRRGRGASPPRLAAPPLPRSAAVPLLAEMREAGDECLSKRILSTPRTRVMIELHPGGSELEDVAKVA